MESPTLLSVREIQADDINHIADYWLNADDNYLLSLGADKEKLPSREGLRNALTQQINSPYDQKSSFALIWLYNNQPIGHCNVNKIKFGEQAHMHLHLWPSDLRKKGMGQKLVLLSLPHFFNKLKLKQLFCEPYALNPAPNRTLEKIGFELIKEYTTIPGGLNFEQLVKQWKLTKERFEEIEQ